MSNIAQCPDCNKKYKVPHLDKEWKCKACGVALLLPGGDDSGTKPSEPQAKGKICPDCGTTMEPGMDSCERCSDSRGEDPSTGSEAGGHPPKRRIQTGRRKAMANSAIRGTAKKELRKLALLRFLVKVGLVMASIEVVVCIAMITKLEDYGQWDTLMWPLAKLIISVGAFWFLWSTHKALATIYGRPLPYVLILGALYFALFLGTEGDIARVGLGLRAAIFWLFVVPLRRIQELKDENSEAFEEPKVGYSAPADPVQHRRRLIEAKRSAKERNRRLVIFGGVAAVLLVVALGYKAANKPETPGGIVLEFQSAWNEGDFAAIGSLATPGNEDRWTAKLKRRNTKLGWDGSPPTLRAGDVQKVNETSIRVIYPTAGGSMGARFSLSGKIWVLKSLDYRKLPD